MKNTSEMKFIFRWISWENMKKESLIKNYIYQFLYQALILVLPLIISPYLTRTLRETSLGIYTYARSISYYFVLVAMLGIVRYGQRVIAQNSSDEVKLRNTFWSLYCTHSVVSIIVLIVYLAFVSFVVDENKEIYLLESMYVTSALFDVTWLFYGLENFKSVVLRNVVIKIVECILIFTTIKCPDDLWKYTCIIEGGILIGQVVLLPQAIRQVKPIKFSISDVFLHVKPLLLFSVAVIASSLYTVFDKTLLGLLDSKSSVAFYEYSDKIISVPRTFIAIIGTVMFPRACKLAAEGKVSDQRKYIQYSVFFTAFISFASMFGLAGVANEFAKLYYGNSFEICGYIMIIMSPIIYIVGMGEIIRTQYMIPNHMDIKYNICLVLNAIVNIVISVLLIPVWGVYGAVAGSITAELFGFVFQCIACKKFIRIKDILIPSIPFAVIGIIMFIVLCTLNTILPNSPSMFIAKTVCGGCVYIALTLVYLVIFKKEFARQIISVLKSMRS